MRMTLTGYRSWKRAMRVHLRTLRAYGARARCETGCPCDSPYAIAEELIIHSGSAALSLRSAKAWRIAEEFLAQDD